MIDPRRIHPLNQCGAGAGGFVLYWMQSAQRVADNHALAHAIELANRHDVPVLVAFCLVPDFPSASSRHYRFMLQGLHEVQRTLGQMGIALTVRVGDPVQEIAVLAGSAVAVVVDRGYTHPPRRWYARLAQILQVPLVQVETNIVVPVGVASDHQEYAARTLRPKLMRALPAFLEPVDMPACHKARDLAAWGDEPLDVEQVLDRLAVARLDLAAPALSGGESEALVLLRDFCEGALDRYPSQHNDPAQDVTSGLSPFLHFGQIAPHTIARAVLARGGEATEAFVEQLVVRRELAINYVQYQPQCATYAGLPDWCRRTLEEHAGDPRPVTYSLEQLERAQTHDPYWNAAQREMLLAGKMFGYMRMYWGKKIIEWTPTPQEAYARALYLNDKYELDGRDPNGYVGVAWCFGLHDQPWRERAIFGKIRYMNAQGLERKFDIGAYVARVQALEKGTEPP